MEKQTITLKQVGKSWIASNFTNGKPCPKTVELFGTHELPTPFGSETCGTIPLARIAALNPDALVTLA